MRAEKKAIALLEYDLRAAGKETKMATIAAKLGMAKRYERPESDERTQFWLNTFHLVARERPYTYGAPLPIRPLSILDLIERLRLPADPEEAVAIVCALDDCWIKWKDSKQSTKTA